MSTQPERSYTWGDVFSLIISPAILLLASVASKLIIENQGPLIIFLLALVLSSFSKKLIEWDANKSWVYNYIPKMYWHPIVMFVVIMLIVDRTYYPWWFIAGCVLADPFVRLLDKKRLKH